MALLRPFARSLICQQDCLLRSLAGLQISQVKTYAPLQPKRPLTPFFLFKQEKYADVKKENPASSITDISKKIGELYKALPKERKETYVKKYMADKAKYVADTAKFLANLSPEEREELAQEQKAIKDEKKDRRTARRRKQYGMPKRPPTSFSLFLQSKSSERENVPVTDYMKSVAALWRRMPEQDKQVYVDKALAYRAEYDKEMKAWNTKMKRTGHKDLVTDAVTRKDLTLQIQRLKKSYKKKEDALKRELVNLKKEREKAIENLQKKLPS